MIKLKRGWGLAGLLWILSAGVGYAQTLPSESYDLALSKGVHALNKGQFEEALSSFQAALSVKPKDIKATYHLGVAQRSMGRYKAADETLKAVAALDPSFQPVHFDLGVTAYHLGHYDEALKELLLSESYESRAGSRQAMTQYHLGLTYQKLERFEDSAPRFLRAAALAPELEANARYFAGVAFYRRGLTDESRDELKEVERIAHDANLLSSSRELLRTMDADRVPNKRLSVKVSLGGQYDSNVVLLPDGSPLPSGISNRSDLSAVGTVQAAFRLIQSARWDGRIRYRFYQSLHQDLDQFDVQNHDLGLKFIHYPSSRPYQMDFTYLFSAADVDQENYFRIQTGGVGLEFSGKADDLTRIEYQYQNRDFIRSDVFTDNDDRTGINHSAGIVRYRFFSEKKGNLHGGYRYDQDITSGDDWDARAHHLNFGVMLPPVWVQPSLEGEVAFRNYANPNFLSTKTPQDERKDTIQLYT